MNIVSKYDIGEKVCIRNLRTKEYIVTGEICQIFIHKNGAGELCIKYNIVYSSEGEWYQTDRWEEDLIQEDLTCSAMPKLKQIIIDR